jgi:ribosomal-protein-serine acetyltransferase
MSFLHVDENIKLKRLELEDADAIFAVVDANRNYLREWLPWVDSNATIEDTKLFVKSTQEQHEQNLGFQCGIWYRGAFAGIVGFHRIDWMNKNVEIGYWLGEKFQGNGIITKSCKVLVDIAFNDYHLNRVQIRAAAGNRKSNAIIERLGFVREGTNRQAEFLYNHYVDLNVYGMVADEWKARNDSHTSGSSWM